jgi:hypothetical protein
MIMFLLSLIACGDDAEDSASEDTGSSTAEVEQVNANFYCG